MTRHHLQRHYLKKQNNNLHKNCLKSIEVLISVYLTAKTKIIVNRFFFFFSKMFQIGIYYIHLVFFNIYPGIIQ